MSSLDQLHIGAEWLLNSIGFQRLGKIQPLLWTVAQQQHRFPAEKLLTDNKSFTRPAIFIPFHRWFMSTICFKSNCRLVLWVDDAAVELLFTPAVTIKHTSAVALLWMAINNLSACFDIEQPENFSVVVVFSSSFFFSFFFVFSLSLSSFTAAILSHFSPWRLCV